MIITAVATLFAGLYQRGSFKDDWVTFNEKSKTTDFGSYGLAYGDFPEAALDNQSLILDIETGETTC